MFAIFENGSHQYRVSEGDLVTVDRHDGEHGAELVFDKVLLVTGADGATIGTPTVAGARVVGLAHGAPLWSGAGAGQAGRRPLPGPA